MKVFLSLMMINALLLSGNIPKKSDIVEIKDTSGLSPSAVRKIAEESDENKSTAAKKAPKQEATWENLTPKTNGFDWVKTKKGEWFKGKVKAMYDKKLEFDSEEMGIYLFDLKDIAYIKTHNALAVNIGSLASVTGIVRLDNQKLRIIQGDAEYEFKRKQIVSFAPDAELERNLWSGKVSISIDKRNGNQNQFDYTAKANLKRRTYATCLSLDYLGRISSLESKNITDDHRFTQTYDVYITRKFFWTPLFSEYYTDKYKNIKMQLTGATGIGYKIFDTSKLEWSVSGGPGILYTKFNNVEKGTKEKTKASSLEMRTSLEYELFKKSDLIYDYKLTLTNKESGAYKHHMILSLENEITSWLDLDLSFIWDHIKSPAKLKDNTSPLKNDYQFLIGLGVEF